MRGKNKCKILKEIRQKIASENDIPYVTQECTYQGECKGTCPRCEAELRYLEQQLEKRQRLGKSVTVAALAATLMAGLTACPSAQPTAAANESFSGTAYASTEALPPESYINVDVSALPGVIVPSELEGDVAYSETDTTEASDMIAGALPVSEANGDE